MNDQYYNYKSDLSTTLPKSNKGEHCFSIASKEITANGKKQYLIAVILRGTESFTEIINDWFTNFNDENFYEYKAYGYFKSYADKVRKQFVNYVSSLQDKEGNYVTDKYEIKVMISGHSLGGAAANLFAAELGFSQQNLVKGSSSGGGRG